MVCSSKFLMILSSPPVPLLYPRPSAALRLARRSKTLLCPLPTPAAAAAATHHHLFIPYSTPLKRSIIKSQIHTQAQAAAESEGQGPLVGSDRRSSYSLPSSWYRHHPWPEWTKLVDGLRAGGYYYSGRRNEEGDEDGDEFAMYEGLPEEFVRDSEACLAFARDRSDALRYLAKKNIEVIVDNCSPFLFKNGARSTKRMKLFMEGYESNVLVSERAQTVDVMRYILSYTYNLLSNSDRIRNKDADLVEESVRSLLAEFVNINESVQVSKFTQLPLRHDPSGHEQFSRSPKQDIEMKRGDWICPKCNFMNFARNTRCLECEESRPKKQLTGREWECPQCEFHNYGRNISCLRCDCRRPGEISCRSNTDKSEIEQKLAANDEKAERWFGKMSQLGNSADMASAVADEDFPEIMPMRKGVNRFVVSTRKTPLERRLAANSQNGSDSQQSESSINRSLDRILGRTLTPPAAGEADPGAQSRLRDNILSKSDPGYVPFVPLPPDMFRRSQSSNNDVQHKNDPAPTKADAHNDFPTKNFQNSVGDNNNNGSYNADFASAVPDEDFPEIMPIRKGENRFVVSKKKDRSLTSPQYKRRLAMEQANKSDFVPFVPFPPDYFAKKDKQTEVAPVQNEQAVSESSSPPEKVQAVPEGLHNKLGTSSWASTGNESQQSESKAYNQSTKSQFPGSSYLNERRADNSNASWNSGIPKTGSASNTQQETFTPQTESYQNTRQSWSQQNFSGKSLEGSAVTEPDPLDMSEEAKAARWFRRAAQIKDISELSAIPDEDFPEIMPMRKGVNRFVVSKRKTPLERRLTSPQYRRNLPIVSSEPDKGAN